MAGLAEMLQAAAYMDQAKAQADPVRSGVAAFGQGIDKGVGSDSGLDRAYKIMALKDKMETLKTRQEELGFKKIEIGLKTQEMDLKKQELDIKKQEANQQGQLWDMYSKQFGRFSNSANVKTEQGKIAQMVDTDGKRTADMAQQYQDRPELDITATSSGKIVPKLKKKSALKKPTQSGIQDTAVVDGVIVPIQAYDKQGLNEATQKAIDSLGSYPTYRLFNKALAQNYNKFEAAGVDMDLLDQEARRRYGTGSDFRRSNYLPSNIKKTSEAVDYIMSMQGKTKEEAIEILKNIKG